MMKLMLCSMFLYIILMIFMIILYMMSKKSSLDREKSSSFECGFDPISSSRLPFSSHFFLIAVIFLIFDVELVLVMPVILLISFSDMYMIQLIMLFFMLFLIMGLYHEWKNNMLEWM
uniref:NADH-ubiquinone oxidoreductase chain 3 n=1 Tax=Derotettix mendosensis TaxID=2219932 RepID=A0A3Q8GFG0_9HEMI|nr:NADH dehydrogenase subunit 3 [Derotettix mendosensis]